MPQYKRPPITEAVIEIQFEQQLPREVVEKLLERFKKDYLFSDPFAAIGIEVDLSQRQSKFEEESTGYKLSTADRADVLLVMSKSIACSRMPPYVGWESFRARAEENWRSWKRVAGYRKVQRVGVRYINRIDIPAAPGEVVRIENYLRVYPESPEKGVMSSMGNYTMQLVGPLGEDNCKLVINSGVVLSPLIKHVSVLFDIDISREGDLPQNDGELWALIDRIRVHKNRVFEASVTDKARELFNT